MSQQPSGGLTFPIKLRCASAADLMSEPGLEAALSRALGRAFARARAALPVPLVLGSGVALQAPRLVAGGLSGADATALLARVRRAVEAAARAQSIPTVASSVVRLDARRRRAGAAAFAERFDRQRYDAATGTYEMPSYGGGKVRTPTSGTQADGNAALIRATVAKLDKDDGTLFRDVLSKTRMRFVLGPPNPVHLDTLRAFARQNPAKFRQLLLQAVIGGAAAITRVYDFSGGAFKIVSRTKQALQEAARHLDIAADAVHLADILSEAAWLSGELERRLPGFQRLIALLSPLDMTRRDLINYLAGDGKTSDAIARDVLKALDHFDLWRYPALVAALTASGRITSSSAVRDELLESNRLLASVLTKVREIDGWLVLYRLRSGAAADDLEEIQILLQARARYLDLVADVVPGAPYRGKPAGTLLTAADKFYADWRGLAADKKLNGLRDTVKEIKAKLPPLNRDRFYTSQGREFFGVPKFGIANKPEELATRLDALAQRVEGADKRGRGDAYLNFAIKAQRELGELAVKWQLVTYWRTAIDLVHEAEGLDVGTEDDRRAWAQVTDGIIDEIRHQYEQPDFTSLSAKTKDWLARLQRLSKEINDTAQAEADRQRKRKFWIGLAITVVAIVVTRGLLASAIIEGLELGTVATTLVGAGTLTAVTTAGRALVLHEEVGVGDVLKDFGQNAAFGFLFGWLNLRFVAFGRYLAPGRDIAQLAIVLGTDAAVGNAVNLVLSKLATGALPDDMESFIISSVVLTATGALLGGAQTREQLRQLRSGDALMARFDNLKQQTAEIFKEMQKIGTNGPNRAQHASLKQRLLGVLPDIEDVLKKMSGMSDTELATLGLSRAKLNAVLRIVPQYTELVRTSEWSPASGQPRARALRAPSDADPRQPPTVRSPGRRKPPPPPRPKGRATRTPEVDEYPAGLVHMELTRNEAYESFEQSIAADPTRETTIYRDLDGDEHIVVQGEPGETKGDWSREPHLKRRWHLVEHYHPKGIRYASAEDFYGMMFPQLEGWIPRQAVSTTIRFEDPVTKRPGYTDIGYTPGSDRPYWIVYRDEGGVWRRVTFKDPPWVRGSDYQTFLKGGSPLPPSAGPVPGVRTPPAEHEPPGTNAPPAAAEEDIQIVLAKLGLPPGSLEDLAQGHEAWGSVIRGQAEMMPSFAFKDGRLTVGVMFASNPPGAEAWDFVKAFLAYRNQSINLARKLGASVLRFEGHVVAHPGIEKLLKKSGFKPVPGRASDWAFEKPLAEAQPAPPTPGGPVPSVKSPSGRGPGEDDPGPPTFGNVWGDVPRGGHRIELREINGRWLEITPGGGGVRLANGTYFYVRQDGRTWGSQYGHVAASMGNRVTYAGKVSFEKGIRQTPWSNESGSYRPAGEFAKQSGVPGDFELVGPEPGKRVQLPVFQPGKDESLEPRDVKKPGAAETKPAPQKTGVSGETETKK